MRDAEADLYNNLGDTESDSGRYKYPISRMLENIWVWSSTKG